MKHLGLSVLVLLTLTAVSCGKKDSKSSGSSTSALSTDSCNKNGNIAYAERIATVDWTTGVVTIGKTKYQPHQLTQNAKNTIDQGFKSKAANVSYRGIINAQGQTSMIYKMTIRAAMVNSVNNLGYMPGAFPGYQQPGFQNGVQPGVVGGTSCQLDIQSAKFRN